MEFGVHFAARKIPCKISSSFCLVVLLANACNGLQKVMHLSLLTGRYVGDL